MSQHDAWAAYWRDAPGRGCLSDAPLPVKQRLQEVWRSFAGKLPEEGRLLDLATGTGAVPALVLQARPGLDVVGVDYAAPSIEEGRFRVLGGIDCAALPFDDASFDAVTSQFGIEYCDAGAADEAARVLRPGGALCFVLHHRDSRAVQHNAARAAALEALRDAGLFRLGRRLAGRLPGDAGMEAAVAAAQRRHSAQSISAELPAAVVQALRSPQPLPRIAEIERGAGAEIERLRAMEAAALDEAGVRGLADRLAAHGIACAMDGVAVPGEPPVAWVVIGNRN